MTASKHVNGYGLALRILRRFALHVPYGDDRNNDLLKHGATVNKACAAAEMKPIRASRNPELHSPARAGCDARLSMPDSFVIGEILSEEIAIVAANRSFRPLIELASFRIAGSGLGKQETVVGRDDDVVSV